MRLPFHAETVITEQNTKQLILIRAFCFCSVRSCIFAESITWNVLNRMSPSNWSSNRPMNSIEYLYAFCFLSEYSIAAAISSPKKPFSHRSQLFTHKSWFIFVYGCIPILSQLLQQTSLNVNRCIECNNLITDTEIHQITFIYIFTCVDHYSPYDGEQVNMHRIRFSTVDKTRKKQESSIFFCSI